MNQILEELGSFAAEIIGGAVVLGILAGAVHLLSVHGHSLISWFF